MKDKQEKKYLGFFKQGSFLYELVGDQNYQGFLFYDSISKQEKSIDSFVIDDVLHLPPGGNLVDNKVIKLATHPINYGSDKNLFDSIKHFINKYVDLPESYLIISSLYVLLTWVYDCFDVLPYLRVIGDFGTGKSRFLQVVGSLCYKACFAGGATTVSPIFRIIELYKGVTLVFDEADFRFSGPDADMTKILNCGYMKGVAVLRTEGEGKNREPRGFNVYGPKIIATRQTFQDTALESRCLSQVMSGRPRKDIPKHLPKSFEEEALELRNKLLRFRLDKYFDIEVDEAEEIESLDSRINQVALPILSVLNDEGVKIAVRKALEELQGKLNVLRQDDDSTLVIRALVQIFKNKEFLGGLTYKDVAKKINQLVGVESDFIYQISPSKIGRLNKSVLNLDTYLSNGITTIRISKENVQKIQGFNLSYKVDEVDLVDLFYQADKQFQGEIIPDQIKNALF